MLVGIGSAMVDWLLLSGGTLLLLIGGIPSLALELFDQRHWLATQLIACAVNLAIMGLIHARLSRAMKPFRAWLVVVGILIVTGLPPLLIAWNKMAVH